MALESEADSFFAENDETSSTALKVPPLQYGSYFSGWRRRLALKIWVGWPTFPLVFLKGTFVGGASDLQKLIESGEFKKLLAE